MMFKFITTKLCLMILLLGAFSIKAQESTLPNRLVYNYTQYNETIKLQLIYNDSVSVSTSNKIGYDSSFSSKSAMNVNSTTGISIKVSNYDSIGKIIKRNHIEQTILEREQKIGFMPPFWVQEDWVPITWQLLDKTKKINGYDCKMAKGTFRGREYTAWYAPALPYPYGPWKLFGLPGIILEAQDKNKQFHFVIDTLTYISDTASEFKVAVDTLISLKDYVYYQDNKVLFVDEIRIERAKQMGHSYGGPSYFNDPINVRREARIDRMYEWESKLPTTDDSPTKSQVDSLLKLYYIKNLGPNQNNKPKFLDDNKHAPKSPQQQVIINDQLR